MKVAYTVRDGMGVVSLVGPADHVTDHVTECLMSQFEPFVYDAICGMLPSVTRAAEVGSFRGGSASIVAHCMRARGKSVRLFAHDTFEAFRGVDIDREFDASMRAWDVDGSVVKVKGDSKDTHSIHEDVSLDYVFIDGDHTYEGATADIVNFVPKVKPTGWLVIQDCIDDVRRAVIESVPPEFSCVLFVPPAGHYVAVCHRDPEAVRDLQERMDAVMEARPTQLPFTNESLTNDV